MHLEFIVFRVKQQLDKVDNMEIKIGEDIIQNAPSVRNLGMHFDSEPKHTAQSISLPVPHIIHYKTSVE